MVVATLKLGKCSPSTSCVTQQNFTSKRLSTIPQGHVCQTRPTTTFQVVADKRVKKTQQVHLSCFGAATQLKQASFKQQVYSAKNAHRDVSKPVMALQSHTSTNMCVPG